MAKKSSRSKNNSKAQSEKSPRAQNNSEPENKPDIQPKADCRLGRLRSTPRSVAHGLETLEAYSMRQVNADNIRQNAEHAKHERFRASCEKFRQFLAYANVRAYWLDQAEPIIKTEKNWQGSGGTNFNYEWPRDKAKIYAIVLLALDYYSSVKRIPENLRQSEFCRVNKNIFFHIEEFDLAPEYLEDIEADLSEKGLWPIVNEEPNIKTKQDSQSGSGTDITNETKPNKDSFLSPRKLADIENVPYELLRKRLGRLRKQNHNCFIQNMDRKRKEPEFLYRYLDALPIIKKLKKASSKISSKRPAQKKS